MDPAQTADLTALKARLQRIRDRLYDGLIEREVPMRLALLAALAGEHLLLVGPPGTAKSLLARRLHLAFRDAPYFEYLLTRFSVPEELFGPLSITALERDEYRRKTERYLPTAAIAFLDEIFKANSAILNALLTLLNEREFDNGGERARTPLISVIGASNELPESEELHALYDRFLLRHHVGFVSEAGFDALLDLRGDGLPEVAPEDRLDAALVAEVRRRARDVVVPDNVKEMLKQLRRWLPEQQITVTDRRWRKIVGLLQVAALTDGRAEVSIWDGWLLQFCAWEKPEQRALVQGWYEGIVGKTETEDPQHVIAVVSTWEKRLKQHQERQSQAMDRKGRPLFRRSDGRATTKTAMPTQLMRGSEPLYLGPAEIFKAGDRSNHQKGYTRSEVDYLWHNQTHWSTHNWPGRESYFDRPENRLLLGPPSPLAPLMEPMRYAEAHIADNLRQINAVHSNIASFIDQLDRHLASLTDVITTHMWVDTAFADTARRTLDGVRVTAVNLLARIDRVRTEFNVLPRMVDAATLDSQDGQTDDEDASEAR